MQTETAKWELDIVLKLQHALELAGRVNYEHNNRIKELRAYLDSQEEKAPLLKNPTTDEIPF